MDFKFLAQAAIISAAALAFAPAVGTPSIVTKPTNDQGMGLRMPVNGNNACAVVEDYACEGFYYGVGFGEHFTGLRVGCVYTQVALFVAVGGGFFHGASIVNLNIEASGTGIQSSGSSGGRFPINITQMSVETLDTDIDDPNSNFGGDIGYANINGTAPVVNGGAHVRIINQQESPGNVTAPGIPSSTVALKNPFWRDAAVTVVGGTVSAIAVDGVATGLTSGTVIVPSGKNITLTYSVVPTSWTWTLL